MNYFLTVKSKNAKTGPIPVTTVSQKSCEQSNCQLLKTGCYAGPNGKGGPMSWFWKKVTDGTKKGITDLTTHLNRLRELPEGTLVRLHQAGQHTHTKKGTLNRNELRRFISATSHLKTINYVHSDDDETIKWANDQGYTLIKSCDSESQLRTDFPNALVLDVSLGRNFKTETFSQFKERASEVTSNLKQRFLSKGFNLIVCPATTHDDITCKSCELCSRLSPSDIIGFPAHGVSKNKIKVEH